MMYPSVRFFPEIDHIHYGGGPKPFKLIMLNMSNAILIITPIKAFLLNGSLFFQFEINTREPKIRPAKNPNGEKSQTIKNNITEMYPIG